MIILDSNIWIAFLDKDDSQHEKAKKIFDKLVGEKIVIPEYVFLEVCSVLAMKKERKKWADDFLEISLSNKDVIILNSTWDLFLETISFFKEKNDKKLSFVDCCLAVLAREHMIATFDEGLKKKISKKKIFS